MTDGTEPPDSLLTFAQENGFYSFIRTLPFMPGNLDYGLLASVLITVLFMVGIAVYLVLVKVHPVIYKAFLILLGFIIGTIAAAIRPSFQNEVTTACPAGIIYTLLPILLFCYTLSIDYHTLCRNIKHISMISISTFNGHMFIVTILSYPLLHYSFGWSLALVFMFTAITSAVMSEYTVDELGRVQGQVRQLQLLVQGEKLISTTLALLILSNVSKVLSIQIEYHKVPISYMIQYITLQIIVGSGVGLLCGVVIRYPFKYAYKDISAQLTLILSAIYISYFVSEIFGGNGPLAVVFFGIMLSSTKIKMSSAAENFFKHFWPLVSFVADTLIYFELGVIHGILPVNVSLIDISFVFILYLLIVMVRALIYLILSPIITKSGPQLSFQHLAVAIWGVYRGSPTVMFAMIFFINYYHTTLMAVQILTYSTVIVLLSMFCNVVLMKNVLRILGMYELSRTRLVNMNRAMAQVYNCREKGIFSLKMDRVIADANWQVVENITKMSHPYRKKLDVADIDDDFGDETQKRVISCGECGTEVTAPPTKKELSDITIEAKHRILKAQLVSFWRQYDNGTLSRHGIRILANLVESAMVREDPVLESSDLKIQREGSKTLRCLKKFFGSLLTVTSKTHRFIPTNWFRAICFRICTSRSFQITMACLALVDMILLIYLLSTYFFRDYRTKEQMKYGLVYQSFDLAFYSIFAIEFWLQIAGIGIIQYFVSHISKIEFAANIVIRTSEVAIYSNTCVEVGHMISVYDVDYIIMHLKVLLLFRVTRIYIFIVALIPKLLNMVDRQMDDDLMRCYDIGKAYLVSLDRVMKFLTHIVSNETVYNNLKNMMEEHRQRVTKELGLIQKDRPTIAVTIKTKHAIRHVVNTMNNCITEMKEEGILDTIENKALLESIDRVKKKLRDLSLVHPCTPDLILREVPWLAGDPDNTSFFLEHARLSSYDANEVIIHYRDNPNGLYILATGMVKTYYTPSKFNATQSKAGILPNYDFFVNLRFDAPQEEYVVGGNLIGEMGIVTGRPYDMQVVCETAVHLYYIPLNVVKAVVQDSGSAPVIQARIWKVISIRISLNLLHHTPHFQGWPRERLLLYLQRGLVPILTGIHSIHINEYVDDMLLVEGVAMDHATRTIFCAPFYVPRTVQKILLPSHPLWNFKAEVQTRLMIIPNPHSDQEDLMGPDGIFKDQYGMSLTAQDDYQEEDGDEEEMNEKGCEHGPAKAARALANRLLQVQKRRQRVIGFMDYTPHISGPIEGIPAKTTYIIKKDKKSKEIIETTAHPRTMLDSKINYIQDIKEESETGSMHDDEDDEEDEAKRKKRTSRHRSSARKMARYKASESFDRVSSNFGLTIDQDLSEKKLELQVIESSSEELVDMLTKEAQTTLQMDETFLSEWRERSPERPFKSFGSLSLGKSSFKSFSFKLDK